MKCKNCPDVVDWQVNDGAPKGLRCDYSFSERWLLKPFNPEDEECINHLISKQEKEPLVKCGEL